MFVLVLINLYMGPLALENIELTIVILRVLKCSITSGYVLSAILLLAFSSSFGSSQDTLLT
jgi:hypothetical protein